MNFGTYAEQIAKRKTGNLEGWKAFKFEMLGDTKKGFTDTCKITGGVPRILSRGKHKGQSTWAGVPHQVAYVTEAEVRVARDEYEVETGNCAECQGKGETFAGWSKKEGTTYRECSYCKGSGKKESQP